MFQKKIFLEEGGGQGVQVGNLDPIVAQNCASLYLRKILFGKFIDALK